MRQSFNKIITAALLLIVIVGQCMAPRPVYAQAGAGAPVIDIANLTNEGRKEVVGKIGEVLKNTALLSIRNVLSAFLGKLAYDSAVWIASSGTGQQGLVFDEPVGEYLTETLEAAGGGVIDAFATASGLDAAGLCDPGDNFRIGLSIGLDTSPRGPYKPSCTLAEMKGNWQEAYSDPKFSDFVELQFDPSANPLGISLEAANKKIVAQGQAEKAAEIERMKSSFRDVAATVSKSIRTPGDYIKDRDIAQKITIDNAILQQTGNAVSDAASVFSSTLISKLLERAQKGLANLAAGSDLSRLLSGETSGVATGRAAVEETFASLKQPTFVSSGSFDILAELSSCPAEEEVQSINNCAIGSTMSLAISEGWTVQEFVDYQTDVGGSYSFANPNLEDGSISSDSGITPRGIILLKKNRVVPVGWQIASEYLNQSSQSVTLAELANCYSACGSTDDVGSCALLTTDADGVATAYSPFCGLVDPYWVLKAPQNFCEREAPGPDYAALENLDNDQNGDTQEVLFASRLNYCADSRGCIQEKQAGVCTAYGYCTEEERIYRFAGEVCSEEYSSCQSFEDADGNEVSYVKSSLNYNDCATDPGCQWYCLSTNAAGEFDCAGPTETYISCSTDVATNETTYGLSYDVSYETNAVCSCLEEQTCQVNAGSDPGDNDGNGLLDFRECEVTNNNGTPVIQADDTTSICTLSDNCGASNSTYNSATGTCTCTISNTCSVDSGNKSCTITVEESDGTNGKHECSLAAESGSSICSEEYSTYSTSPYCEVASSGLLNCGDTCYTDNGGTCTNSLGNPCTDGDTTYDADGTADGDCTLVDTCSIANGAYNCTSDSGNTCVLGTIAESPDVANDTLYFDNNVGDCDSSDAGCNEYIRIKSDTNLVPNALFEYYDAERNTINDSNNDGSLDPTVDGDDIAFCTHNGQGCATDANCIEDLNSDGDGLDADEAAGECIGWIQNGVTAYVLTSEFDSGLTAPNLGDNYIQLPYDSSGGTLDLTIDTGHDLANRTFTFSYSAMTLGSACETNDVTFTIGTADGSETSGPITADSAGADYAYTSSWNDYSVTYTFPDESDTTAYGGSGNSGTEIKVAIKESTSCSISLEGATLYEANEFSGDYINYSDSNVVALNSDTISCEAADVGCELYIEDGKDESDGVPGIVTNPDSDACLDASGNYDYADPSCNQCNGDTANDQTDDYYVGCGFYQEMPLDSAAPLTTDPLPSWLTAGTDSYAGAIQRLGGYCEVDSSQHCYANSDCTSGACIDYLSIIPSSGTQCSAAVVGCEEYTNLAAVEDGGEGLEYYTQLQQCVRTDDQSTGVFYTFSGSDTAGVQITDHTLKVDETSTAGAPCTHLDQQSEDYNADCVDSTVYTATERLAWDCGPAGDLNSDGTLNDLDATTDDLEYGTDADCRQYINDVGTIFYRYESDVIIASDDCVPLRNSLDTRVYFGLTAQSNACSAAAVGCREYKGTNSGSEETIINEGFAANTTDDWANAESTSNESVLTAGYSLQLHDADTTSTSNPEIQYALYTAEDVDNDGVTDTAGLLEAGASYILTFWAKVTEGGTLKASFDFATPTDNTSNYYFTTDGYETTSTSVTLDSSGSGEWQRYVLGPVILSATEALDDGDEYFELEFTGTTATSEAYIDTINLTQSNSHYLIQDTANFCNGFEGCREYEDRAGTKQYLKSFTRLCADSAVGCEAMIATQNSSHPFTEAYNLDNEYDEDDVLVQYDQPVTLVYDEENECSAQVKGCTELGLPAVDERTGAVTDYETVYLLNTPDSYNSTLCEQPQLACAEYTSEYDGTVYFKDPGEKICELKEYSADSNTYNGWFKLESEASTPDCPVQHDFTDFDNVYASQPLGGVCNSNSIKVSAGACSNSAGTVIDTVISKAACTALDATNVWDESYVDNLIGKSCNQDADCYPDGWASDDPRPRCISNLADDVDVNDGDAHQYADTLDDGKTLTDYVTDFGWVGTCPGDQSGCSEYVDPYSPNITEINRNYSFEDDVRDDDNIYYGTSGSDDADETPTGFPDYWGVPANMNGSDTDGDGVTDTYADIDLDGDGTAEFTSATCSTSRGIMTNSSAYTGSTINPAEGDAALALYGQCAVENIGSYYAVEQNKTYNIQAQVKMDKTLLDTGSNTPGSFSIGVHYYLADGSDAEVDDSALYPVAQEATITYEEGSDTDNLSYWYRFQGNIGLGTTVPIPVVEACSDPTYTGKILCNNSGTCSDSTSTTKISCVIAGATWTANTWEERPVDYARAFIVNNSTSSDVIYIDAFSFKEADKYYYLDYTVDGTAEREQTDGTNSCTDQDTDESAITSDGGCVAFRDITSDTQNYSQDGLDCTTCLLTPNSDSCRYIVDACDTNTVLAVKKDRACVEWLACETASLVEDANGEISSQCFSINRCDRLDEDGNCSHWLANPGFSGLNETTDEHVSSAEGDADSLKDIRNKTGYNKVGVTWSDILTCNNGPYDGVSCKTDDDCINASITCEDTDGDTDKECSDDTLTSCSVVAECYGDNDYGTCSEAFSTEGYYPYGWMTEVGEYGAQTGEDLIELRDFEALYCSGTRGDYATPCITNATSTSGGHCYTNQLIQEVEASAASESPLAMSDVVYVDDAADGSTFADDEANEEKTFCPNTPNFGKHWPFNGDGTQYSDNGWTAMSGDSSTSTIRVTQYESEKAAFNNEKCLAPCENIDLNNVLEVEPKISFGVDAGEKSAFTGGVQYDLDDNIVQSGYYTLSFDGRYASTYKDATAGSIPSTITICLTHAIVFNSDATIKDTKDCFVNGFGQADIVFIVDTSNSMSGPIASIRTAIPGLAASLSSNGIDAQFAVVDLEESPYLEMDLSSDQSTIDWIFSSFCRDPDDILFQCLDSYDANVDPWWGIQSVISGDYNHTGFSRYNEVYAPDALLEFRSEAQPIIVLVTDAQDQQSENGFTESNTLSLLEETNIPIVVVTESADVAYYTSVTTQSGGGVSDGIADADWTTGADSVSNSILNIILDNVDIFQFNEDMEHYSLGPIAIENKSADEDAGEYSEDTITTQLQFMGSDAAPFQIDNVSLLPVLEVNKALNPIGRSCRAYPANDALQCVYAEPSGTQYKGWKGYCLEIDPTNRSKCLVWWPLDVLEGEESIVSREPAGYSGRASVYHCLVSRGLARPAFCDEADFNSSDDTITTADGNGIQCSGTNDNDSSNDVACTSVGTSTGGCFYGANYTIDDTTSGGILEHDIGYNWADEYYYSEYTPEPELWPYHEKILKDGGFCLAEVEEDSEDIAETACNTWEISGYCEEDDSYQDEESCVAVLYTWVDIVDVTNDPDISETGNCIDINDDYSETPPDDEDQEGRYGDSGVDSGDTMDKICFYDVDGRGRNEVRSTKVCDKDSDCRKADTGSYQCVQLTCQRGDANEACSVGGSECESTPAAHTDNPYEVRPLRWQMHDPWEEFKTGDDEGDYEIGLITRLPANEIMRNIHASEMEVIEFNPGSAGAGGGAGEEYIFWGQLNGNGKHGMYDDESSDALSEIGNVWLTDLKQGAIEREEEADGSPGDIIYKPFNCYASDAGDGMGFGCRYWGLWDADFEWGKYEENQLASLSNQSEGHKYDLVYTWVWSNFDFGIEETDGTNCANRSDESDPQTSYDDMSSNLEGSDAFDLWWWSECIDQSLRKVFGKNRDERNPWLHIDGFNDDVTGTWDDIYVEDPTTEEAETIVIDTSDVSGWDGWGNPDDEDDDEKVTGTGHHGGSNTLSLYVDFSDDGYIQAVYILEWIAAQDTQDAPATHINAGFELTYENFMHLDIQTRESCLLMAETVSSNGDTYAWADRYSNGGYEINNGTDDAFDFGEPYEPYGSITPSADTPDAGLWDYLLDNYETTNAWSTFGTQPLMSTQVDSDETTISPGHPLSCIGDCSETVCVGSPQQVGDPCDNNAFCENGEEGPGICMGIGDSTISGNGDAAEAYSDGNDQIYEVVESARNRLKFVVAGMKSGKYYKADFSDENIYAEDGTDYWSTSQTDPDSNIFDNMTQCATDDGSRPLDNMGDDVEYCGVFPTVSGVTINDVSSSSDGYYSIANGQTVTLNFTAVVDPEQLPLNNIYVDWGDGTSPVNEQWQADPTTHTYTHAYNCGPDNVKRYMDNHCEFKPKIVLVDNWNWCSGLKSGTCSIATYETQEECEDHYTTDTPTTWYYGAGDHRYDPTSDSNNFISECESYDEPNITLYVDATS